jgi:type I restriction enzyme, S subunit
MHERTLMSEWSVGRLEGARKIPSSWQLERLADVSILESGHTPARTNPAYWNGDVPWVSLHDTSALSFGEIFNTKLTVTNEGISNSSARILPRGTVALSRTATVGKAVLFGREMATSQDFACFLPSDRVDSRFLLHLFRCMTPEWRRLSAGSTHQTIYMPIFKRLQVLLPPLDEQRRIAEILDTIDEAIQAAERVIAKLSVTGTALLGEVLRQSADVGETVSLSSTGTWLSGGTPSTGEPSFWGGPVPWITASSLRGKYLERSKRTLTSAGVAAGSRLVPEGTLLCVVRGMSLKSEFRVGIAGTELAFGQDCKALRPGDDWVPEFLYLQLVARESEILKLVDEASHGTGRLQMSLLGALGVDRVPVSEQHRLVALFGAHEQRIATEREALAKLRQTRSGLAADLLSGRVRTVAA